MDGKSHLRESLVNSRRGTVLPLALTMVLQYAAAVPLSLRSDGRQIV